MTALRPYAVWSRSTWGNQEVAGESYREKSCRTLLPKSLPSDGVEQTEVAILVREPANRHDRNAVRVEIRGEHVGYLPREDARRYRAILDFMASRGSAAQVDARIWARPEVDYVVDRRGDLTAVPNGRISCHITLALPEPHLLIPMNPPPAAPHAMLPIGSSLMVKSDGIPLGVFAHVLNDQGEAWVHVTLHETVEQLARTTRERVEVRLDGQIAGHLTPATSKKFLPIIRTLHDQGRLCASPAMLRGNGLQVDLRVCGEKAAELSQGWLLLNANHAVVTRSTPEPLAPPAPARPETPPTAPTSAPAPAQSKEPTGPLPGIAGWFPDPQGMAPLRYWDGSAWTGRIRMK